MKKSRCPVEKTIGYPRFVVFTAKARIIAVDETIKDTKCPILREKQNNYSQTHWHFNEVIIHEDAIVIMQECLEHRMLYSVNMSDLSLNWCINLNSSSPLSASNRFLLHQGLGMIWVADSKRIGKYLYSKILILMTLNVIDFLLLRVLTILLIKMEILLHNNNSTLLLIYPFIID